jgi:organic hydroperoxide reductase OsmC/OhrA
MSNHRATIEWTCSAPAADFLKGRYSREHTWTFDGGQVVPASSSPSVVPAPWSNPTGIDPEEAFVASISSCHMLTFVWLAGKAGFAVAQYRDEAVGTTTKNERGAVWVNRVTLSPQITYAGERAPTAEELARLHHAAHEGCFIANSVKTEIVVSGS